MTRKKLCSIKTDAGLDLISAVGHQERGVGSRVWRPESDRSVAKDEWRPLRWKHQFIFLTHFSLAFCLFVF